MCNFVQTVVVKFGNFHPPGLSLCSPLPSCRTHARACVHTWKPEQTLFFFLFFFLLLYKCPVLLLLCLLCWPGDRAVQHEDSPPRNAVWVPRYEDWCTDLRFAAFDALKPDSSLEFTVAAFAAPAETVRWCLKSEQEHQKCKYLASMSPAISCVPKESTLECIVAIKVRTTFKVVM